MRILALFFALALLAVGAPSCANTSGGQPDGGGDVVSAGPCLNSSYAFCNNVCVDVKGDPKNCGMCGKVCGDNLVCSAGACASSCGDGTTNCNGTCISLGSDVSNCGMCGKVCPSGNVCSKGSCALTCQAGLTNCNSDCVDVSSDDNNCGMCGNACAPGQVCVNSQCQATCQSGWITCPVGDSGTTCVDPKNDAQNCNGCGMACPSGYFCVNGSCSVTCGGGTSQCGTGLSAICVDENIDPNHCGSCTNACGTGNVCSAAHCCPTSTPIYCGQCDTFANCVKKSGGAIIAGNDFACALKQSGAVYCWGDNGVGQIGTNDMATAQYNSAQAVVGLGTAVSLGAGYAQACAVTSGGNLMCWGDDTYGELGNGVDATMEYQPVSSGISNALHVGSTYDATCAVFGSGAIDCMGYDGNSEIANGAALAFADDTSPTSTLITSGALTVAGASTDFFDGWFCAVMTSGHVQCWGDQFYGLGDGTSTTSNTPVIVSGISTALGVAVSGTHACVVLQSGGLMCWGDDFYGELGDGATTSQTSPIAATLTSVGSVSQVGVGSDFTCVLSTTGAVWCVGYNGSGQLGNGMVTDSTSWVNPIASGAVGIATGTDFACALMSDNSAKCWGDGSFGQVGDGLANVTNSSPVTVSGF